MVSLKNIRHVLAQDSEVVKRVGIEEVLRGVAGREAGCESCVNVSPQTPSSPLTDCLLENDTSHASQCDSQHTTPSQKHFL